MTTPETIRLYGTAPDSIVDGPGLRYAVFVQGCTHGCPGCHNRDSQPRDGGTVHAIDDVVADIRANGLVHDVTLSGGEPFEQAAATSELARRLKTLGYGIWTYTGYLYEDLLALAASAASALPRSQGTAWTQGAGICHSSASAASEHFAFSAGAFSQGLDPAAVRALLDATDVLVDGPYVTSLRSLGLSWRGSANQRLIDVSASREAGAVVLWETHEDFPRKPASW